MQMNKRAAMLAAVSLFALTLLSCKNGQQNTNQQNGNSVASSARPGRWVVQFRSPSSANVGGTNLAYWSYTSLSVVSPSVVIAAGDMPNPKSADERIGVVIRTVDGGKNWTETLIEQPGMKIPVINAAHFVDANTGWLVGADNAGNGVILKTTDGCATWTASRMSFKQVPTTVFFIDADTGWMGGVAPPLGEDEGGGGPTAILATTDGGRTWQRQYNLQTSINDIFFINKTTGWAAGYKGVIYNTTDGGRTWNPQRSELEAGEGIVDPFSDAAKNFLISGIHFADAENGFAAARAEEEDLGRVLATKNGGQVWSRTFIIADKGARSVLVLSPTEGYAIINDGHYIYHTMDGGSFWLAEQVSFDQDVPFFKIAAADASHVWVAAGGAIFYRVVD